MTLTDDNFATIVDAVREGRGIYANIKKVVGFLLGTNIGEVITVFAAMLLWHKSPLLSMQLLWINLVTDSLPAIALGMEAVEDDIMDQKPRPKKEGIFAHGLGVQSSPSSALSWASASPACWKAGRPWRLWCCRSASWSRRTTCVPATPSLKSGPSPTIS